MHDIHTQNEVKMVKLMVSLSLSLFLSHFHLQQDEITFA